MEEKNRMQSDAKGGGGREVTWYDRSAEAERKQQNILLIKNSVIWE